MNRGHLRQLKGCLFWLIRRQEVQRVKAVQRLIDDLSPVVDQRQKEYVMGKFLANGEFHCSCLDKLKKGEPFFVLRAQDSLADRIVDQWADLAQMHGVPQEKVEEARRTAQFMRDYPSRKYPD